jgi:hypothetical protein
MEAGLTHRHLQNQHPLYTEFIQSPRTVALHKFASSLAMVGIVDTSGKLAPGVIDTVGAP